jgi:hypothetical protein
MRPLVLLALAIAGVPYASAQAGRSAPAPWDEGAPRAQVLVLGTFHFADAGRDGYKPRFDIDVRSPERQREVEDLVERLAAFRPTKVAVERRPERQAELDSLYRAYLAGAYELGANEIYQVGFRLARRLGHTQVWAVDAPRPASNMTAAEYEAEVARRPPVDTTWDVRYTALYQHEDSLKVTMPLREYLLHMNTPERLMQGHGHYLVGSFTSSEGPGDYFGVDRAAGWWARNLRIFRNLQRITASPDERVLVVIGAGHAPLVRHAIEASPEHELVEPELYLR